MFPVLKLEILVCMELAWFFQGNTVSKIINVHVDYKRPDVNILSNSYSITKGGSALVVFQVKDNPKVDLGDDEAAEYKKAKTKFSKNLGVDGKTIVKRPAVQLWTKFSEISVAAFYVFFAFRWIKG